jgi:predicted phosphodiesterase
MTLRIAILSDLHVTEGATASMSHLYTGMSNEPRAQHPMLSLADMMKADGVAADYLVCCGDLGNKASRPAINYAWRHLEDLAKAMRAELIATAGNHDVDSRFDTTSYDSKGFLQNMDPPFPLPKGTQAENDHYWARHFVMLRRQRHRILVLNSSAYHGHSKDPSKPEYLHGRISDFTLAAIKKELEQDLVSAKGEERYHANILVCHHHPHRHQELDPADYSEMEQGTKLIDVLGDDQAGRWIVIHGHKHHPRVTCASGGSSSPFIFGAGSFSAYGNGSRPNQFYLLEFHSAVQSSIEVAVRFKAWSWALGSGWQLARQAASKSCLPAIGGFGYVHDIRPLARRLSHAAKQRLDAESASSMKWDDFVRIEPLIEFLAPADFERLGEELRRLGLQILFSESVAPVQVNII